MRIKIEISGVTPLLMNKFVDLQGVKQEKNPLPREAALQVAYLDEQERLYLPTDNVYACIMSAGRFHKEGKNKITTVRSSLIPAGVQIEEEFVYFSQPTTFEVDSRSVVNPSTGGRIIKHRPRLDNWKLNFVLDLDLKMFSEKTLRAIVDDAGTKVGLGDFRPERKGRFGRFVVTEWKWID